MNSPVEGAEIILELKNNRNRHYEEKMDAEEIRHFPFSLVSEVRCVADLPSFSDKGSLIKESLRLFSHHPLTRVA